MVITSITTKANLVIATKASFEAVITVISFLLFKISEKKSDRRAPQTPIKSLLSKSNKTVKHELRETIIPSTTLTFFTVIHIKSVVFTHFLPNNTNIWNFHRFQAETIPEVKSSWLWPINQHGHFKRNQIRQLSAIM